MSKTQDILFEIQRLEDRLESDHFDHEIRDFVPATGETRKWILSRIETLKSLLPQARHDDQVRAFGWKTVERNV